MRNRVMRDLWHPDIVSFRLERVLHALSDRARIEILRRIGEAGELCCSATCPDLPRSTVSFHFRVMREAGLISSRREGTQLINRIRRAEIDSRFPGLLDAVLNAAVSEEAEPVGGRPPGAA